MNALIVLIGSFFALCYLLMVFNRLQRMERTLNNLASTLGLIELHLRKGED